ncbi:L-type lectin-domain containing receptor kinase IX.1-like [Arachis hypogaea]|uniref:L-type lectin-domain containing receptor kinase IX.1-like n=1 Tax=Arachis hypogaea TaxID=3818 RepID=UPI000DEC8CF5|nr:L-type lectin-domain containing receptor kinase IX.1-like [Arachis hypogaea]
MADCDFQCVALLRIIIIIPVIANAQTLLSFNCTNFTQSHCADELTLQGDASHAQSSNVIELAGSKKNASGFGRVITKGTHLKVNNSRYDFTTNFSFLVFTEDPTYPGDGLAFYIASPKLPIQDHIDGGGLGLAKGYHHLPSGYSFVALEFDTFSNAWDPSGPSPHVGLDLNSVVSSLSETWLVDFSERNKVFNCSIDYNSGTKRLDAFFTASSLNGPVKKQFSFPLDLDEFIQDPVTIGISAAVAEKNYTVGYSLLSWSFSSTLHVPSNAAGSFPYKAHLEKALEIGIGFFLCLFVLILVLLLILIQRGGKRNPESAFDLMDHEFQTGTGPQRISYDRLVCATDNFQEAKKLGRGGFGAVYKGYFKDTDSYAAVKKISADSKQGLKEYAAEVKIISQLRHRNLVRLTGWCHKKNDFVLIYEYMPNGSLDSFLFHGVGFLSWQVRYNIALGLASALLYLQEGWEKCVLHRDIKSSNIMLDSDFNAKLGDFGLARLVDHEKGSRTTVTAGTLGYMAPEYMKTGKVRKESDIYSFGVVLLEIASGKKVMHHIELEGRVTQVSLVEWVWELYGLRNITAAADPNLCVAFDDQQMECMLVVGLWCAHPDCRCRPSVRQVMKVLNFDAPLPILPERMPLLPYLPSTTNEVFLTAVSSFSGT